jgi:hypothetical protein
MGCNKLGTTFAPTQHLFDLLFIVARYHSLSAGSENGQQCLVAKLLPPAAGDWIDRLLGRSLRDAVWFEVSAEGEPSKFNLDAKCYDGKADAEYYVTVRGTCLGLQQLLLLLQMVVQLRCWQGGLIVGLVVAAGLHLPGAKPLPRPLSACSCSSFFQACTWQAVQLRWPQSTAISLGFFPSPAPARKRHMLLVSTGAGVQPHVQQSGLAARRRPDLSKRGSAGVWHAARCAERGAEHNPHAARVLATAGASAARWVLAFPYDVFSETWPWLCLPAVDVSCKQAVRNRREGSSQLGIWVGIGSGGRRAPSIMKQQLPGLLAA